MTNKKKSASIFLIKYGRSKACYALAKKVLKEVFFVMKKYLLVSLTILFAAAFVWAADDAATADQNIAIEADATVSWGIDLGSKTESYKHGFNNEASWKVKFPIYKKADRTSTRGNVPVYGEVVLEGAELSLLSERKESNEKNDKVPFTVDGKVKGLKAKLVFYDVYLSAFSKPNFSANYAEIWKPIDNDDDYEPKDYRYKPAFEGFGTKLGYANKDLLGLDVGLKFGSDGNWKSEAGKAQVNYEKYKGTADKFADTPVPDGEVWINVTTRKEYFGDANGKTKVPYGHYSMYETKAGDSAQYSKYAIGFDLSIKPLDKMLELALTVNSTLSPGYKDANVNFGVEAKSAPVDGLELKAGFDGGYAFATTTKEFDWDTVFTAQYKWVGAGVYVGSKGTVIGGYNADTKTRGKTVDLAVFAKFETKADKDDATNLVEGLDAGVYVGMYQLLAKLKATPKEFPFFAKVWGAYTININDSMSIKPFANVWLETPHTQKVGLAYDVGVTYSPAEKVEVTAKWSQGKIQENKHGVNDVKIIEKSATGGEHYGAFVLSLKVSY